MVNSELSMEILHVMPGYLCNLSCSHCVNDSGPRQTTRLSQIEIAKAKEVIKTHSPRRLIFTGGEPTLHIDLVNELLLSHPNIESANILLTTNGWFSKSPELLRNTIEKLLKVSGLQLSYDTFHGSKLSIDDVVRLKTFCLEREIQFNISICISSPLELIEANKIQRAIGAQVIFQKVEASGRAKTSGGSYKYLSFQASVFDLKCPNLGSITCIPQKGFSVCCSNLIFNRLKTDNFAHPTLEEHTSSDFYKEICSKTFGQMLESRGLASEHFDPEFSAPCRMCEYIHAGDSL